MAIENSGISINKPVPWARTERRIKQADIIKKQEELIRQFKQQEKEKKD